MIGSQVASKEIVNEIRPLQCQTGCLSRCDGSAQLGQGSSSVMVGLYGPADLKPHKEKLNDIAVEVSFIPQAGQSGIKDRPKEVLIRQVVSASVMSSLHPRTGLHIGIQALEDDGSLLSCAINSTCLALIDSGIAMRNLFASVTCAVLANKEGREGLIIDPDQSQLRKHSPDAVITFSFESRERDVISVHVEGRCSESKFQEALSAARDASKVVFDFYRDVVAKKFSKEDMKPSA